MFIVFFVENHMQL